MAEQTHTTSVLVDDDTDGIAVWTVGWTGPFRVTAQLVQPEREIDIDERKAVLKVGIELKDSGNGSALDLTAYNVRVMTEFDFTGKQISLSNHEYPYTKKSPLKKDTYFTLFPDQDGQLDLPVGHTAYTQIEVHTGIFSNEVIPKMKADGTDATPSADPGLRLINLVIDYDLKGSVHDTPRTNMAHMRFVIAAD